MRMKKIRAEKKILLTAAILIWMVLPLLRVLPVSAAEGKEGDPLYYTGGLMAAEPSEGEEGELTAGEAAAYEGPLNGKGLSHDSRFSQRKLTTGIDVSYYQGNINWNKVKAAGVKFAIIRCGYSTLARGEKNQDVKFLEYIKGARAAGIKVGVYYFSQAISLKEARDEAEFAARIIQSSGVKPDLPVFMDVEIVSNSIYSRMISARLSKAAETSICRAFCQTIEAKGYRAGVYSSMNYLDTRMNAGELAEDYIIWLAHYTNKTTYKGDYTFWQHGSTGTVNGISGGVDCNIWYAAENFKKNSSCKDTAGPKTGWQKENGNTVYLDQNGEKVLGMQQIDGKWYYFSRVSGKRMTGWRTVGGKKYYFDKTTALRASGLVKIKNKTYYFDPATGVMQTGLQAIGAETYCFGSDGAMLTGWQRVDGARYRFRSDGRMYQYRGWKTIAGKTYFFDSSHRVLTLWQTIDGSRYYFGSNGVMRTLWQTIGETRYYFGKNGVMRTGLRKIGGYRYFFDQDGAMQTRWQTVGKYRYYFNSKNGHALTGKKVLGGKTYVFDSQGRLT
jgi:glucan-binding YG repeat protein